MPREREEQVKRRRVGKRGKPATASMTEIEDLSERIIAFCDFVMAGVSLALAGQMIDPPAKEQQITRWLDDCPGVRKYFVLKGMESKLDAAKSNTRAAFAELVSGQQKAIVIAAQLSLLRQINDDKVTERPLREMIREHQLTTQMMDSVQLEGTGKEGANGLLDGLSPEDRAVLTGGSLIQKMISYKKEQ